MDRYQRVQYGDCSSTSAPRLTTCSTHHRRLHGRNPLLDTYLWRPLLLGLHACASRKSPLLRLDHWLVRSHRLHNLSPLLLTHCFRFNLLGQVAVTTGIDFSLANLISTTAEVSNGYKASAGKTLGILAVVLLSHVLINLLNVRTLRYMIYTSIVLNTVGVLCLAIAVLAKAPTHQPGRFVFSTFYDGTGVNGHEGWSIRASPAYVAVVGVLMSQYTILGFDASAHLCEETRKAVRDAPLGLISAIAGSCVIGFFLIIALLFSIQDFSAVRSSPLPVLKILTDACGEGGGLVLMVLIMLCVWHCGLFSLVRPLWTQKTTSPLNLGSQTLN